MALAIWIGARVEHVHFNHWILIGLLGAALLAAAARMIRRASIASLRGSVVLALWLAARFLVTPALVLIALAWLVCWAFGLAAAAALLNALALVAYWGGAAILATSVLADLAAAIKGSKRDALSGS
jgi:hypothetical protein